MNDIAHMIVWPERVFSLGSGEYLQNVVASKSGGNVRNDLVSWEIQAQQYIRLYSDV